MPGRSPRARGAPGSTRAALRGDLALRELARERLDLAVGVGQVRGRRAHQIRSRVLAVFAVLTSGPGRGRRPKTLAEDVAQLADGGARLRRPPIRCGITFSSPAHARRRAVQRARRGASGVAPLAQPRTARDLAPLDRRGRRGGSAGSSSSASTWALTPTITPLAPLELALEGVGRLGDLGLGVARPRRRRPSRRGRRSARCSPRASASISSVSALDVVTSRRAGRPTAPRRSRRRSSAGCAARGWPTPAVGIESVSS